MLIILLLGALTASHFCFLAERFAVHRSTKGNSKCNSCQSEIKLYDIIPVLPWLLRKGKAACCKQKIPGRYPLMETLAGFWCVSMFVFFNEALAAALIFSLAGVGLIFTRSYYNILKKATGVKPCSEIKHLTMEPNDAGVHYYFKAHRCGWCATKIKNDFVILEEVNLKSLKS